MKTGVNLLADFIFDFKLEVPGVGVCFNAAVDFTAASVSKKFNCEVHIITLALKKQTVVYLLHQELDKLGIPDTFPFDSNSFFYEPQSSLTINDYDLLRGKYSLTIYPLIEPSIQQSRNRITIP